MMEPDAVIVCNECEVYLSHAPVFLRALSGESLCGACSGEEPDLMRNHYYELVAEHLLFPCKYEPHGCSEALPFTREECDEHPHEVDCKYKAYLCPLDKIGACSWQGPMHSIYLHFLRKHPTAVYNNPCIFDHDIEFSNIFICLVLAYGELFVIETEVVLPEGLLQHSVRLFGKESLAQDFKFELSIVKKLKNVNSILKKSSNLKRNILKNDAFLRKNDAFVSRIGDVSIIHCMGETGGSALTTKISSLIDLMGSFDDIEFSIEIQNVDEWQDDVTEAYCHYCNKWRYLERGVCSNCRLDLGPCVNHSEGCRHVNLSSKVNKHEIFYCNYNDWCEYCDDHIYPAAKSRAHHYLVKHAPHELGVFVNIKQTYGHFLTVFFRCQYGIVLCNYYFSNKKLELHIVTPLLNVDLRHFVVKVFVETPGTGLVAEFIPVLKNHALYDWLFYLEKCEFTEWSSCFNVKIEMEHV